MVAPSAKATDPLRGRGGTRKEDGIGSILYPRVEDAKKPSDSLLPLWQPPRPPGAALALLATILDTNGTALRLWLLETTTISGISLRLTRNHVHDPQPIGINLYERAAIQFLPFAALIEPRCRLEPRMDRLEHHWHTRRRRAAARA